MKYFIALLLFFCCFSGFVFGQKSSVSAIRCGGYISNQYPCGDISPFINFSLGLGANIRFMLPVDNPRINKLGLSANISWNYLHPSDHYISFFNTTRVTAGIFYDFPIKDSRFSISPEIGYGLALHVLTPESGFNTYPDGVFFDQVIDFSVSILYSLPNIKRGSVEVFLAPVYSFMPEQDNSHIHLLGFRTGCMYGLPGGR